MRKIRTRRGGRIALIALAIVVTVIAAALAATRAAPGATRTAESVHEAAGHPPALVLPATPHEPQGRISPA